VQATQVLPLEVYPFPHALQTWLPGVVQVSTEQFGITVQFVQARL
jgi:hypothetical protein